MNTQTVAIDFADVRPSGRESRTLKSIPRHVDEEIDDIIRLELPDDEQDKKPSHTQLPAKNHLVLKMDLAHVPAPLLRKIARELTGDECDPRTVLTACRGLTRDSSLFEEAYIMARVRSLTKNQRIPTDLHLPEQSDSMNSMSNTTQSTTKRPLPPPSHPLAVLRLGHLMDHFGIWVVSLLAIQLYCAWKTAGRAIFFL